MNKSPESSSEIKAVNPKKLLKGMPEYFELGEYGEPVEPDTNPQYLMMNLETGCPLKCRKCAQPGQNREVGEPLTLEERKKVLATAKEIGVRELVIIGNGEPSTPRNFRNIVKPVIEAAHEDGMGTVMFTTAFGIDQEQAEFYRDHDTTVFVSLDSLDPQTYRYLTGTGNLEKVLENIKTLREAYRDSQQTLPDGRKLVRLAINTTIQRDNVEELDRIREFAGDDMQFIANVPMARGELGNQEHFVSLMGFPADEEAKMEQLKKIAAEKSETGGHSSLAEGACSYFNRGISIDSDGQLLSCGYASESAHHLGNIREELNPQDLLKHYQEMRKKYAEWCEKVGRKATCPLRDKDYKGYIKNLQKSRINS